MIFVLKHWTFTSFFCSSEDKAMKLISISGKHFERFGIATTYSINPQGVSFHQVIRISFHMLSPDFWLYAKVSASVAWENWILWNRWHFITKRNQLMWLQFQKVFIYYITYINEVRQKQRKEEVGSLVEEKKAILKGDLGQLCVDWWYKVFSSIWHFMAMDFWMGFGAKKKLPFGTTEMGPRLEKEVETWRSYSSFSLGSCNTLQKCQVRAYIKKKHTNQLPNDIKMYGGDTKSCKSPYYVALSQIKLWQ